MRLRSVSILTVLACAACGQSADTSSSASTELPSERAAAEGPSKTDLWVTSERAPRHTCASISCGVVGQYFFREKVEVMERGVGWVRVSRYYDAACKDGRSDYVDQGNDSCLPINGIQDGQFAEWVQTEHLSEVRPSDPSATASADETLVAQSDDFARYRRQFAVLAQQLIASGRCSRADFEEWGGFIKSVNEYRDQPVYFTYCGGASLENKVYVNAREQSIMN